MSISTSKPEVGLIEGTSKATPKNFLKLAIYFNSYLICNPLFIKVS